MYAAGGKVQTFTYTYYIYTLLLCSITKRFVDLIAFQKCIVLDCVHAMLVYIHLHILPFFQGSHFLLL